MAFIIPARLKLSNLEPTNIDDWFCLACAVDGTALTDP
jgi:hypothetical protein